MSTHTPRIVEVRLLVLALVDVAEPTLTELLTTHPPTTPLAHLVASEVVSNLESVAYVTAAFVSQV